MYKWRGVGFSGSGQPVEDGDGISEAFICSGVWSLGSWAEPMQTRRRQLVDSQDVPVVAGGDGGCLLRVSDGSRVATRTEKQVLRNGI